MFFVCFTRNTLYDIIRKVLIGEIFNMRVWRITGKDAIECVAVDRTIKEDEVKFKLTKAAISNSDIAIFNGLSNIYPIVPVGISVGLVSEAPEGCGLRIGERVIASPYVADEKDEDIIRVMGSDIDGVLGDYAIVPLKNIHLIPEGVTDKEAIFTDHISTALSIINELDIDKLQYVVILGCNCLGIILAELCIYYQAVPIIVDKIPEKLNLARECGVYYTINPAEDDVMQTINSITGGRMADVTIYSVSDSCSIANIYNYTRNKGKLGIVCKNKLNSNKITLDIKGIYKKELTVVGVNNGHKYITSAINLLANKQLKLSNLIEKEGKFSDMPDVFIEAVKSQEIVLKTIINFD